MSIKRYSSEKDNTISSAFKINLSDRGTASNMGSSDILEVFAIFGQASSASLEQSRVLVQFPVDKIVKDRNASLIPQSGSVTFKLKMFNAEHNQTVPEKVTCTVHPLVKKWSEGGGLDMEGYLDTGVSNWISSSTGVAWANQGGDFIASNYMSSAPIPYFYQQYLDKGTENLDIDVTGLIEEYIKNQAGNSAVANGSILFNTTNAPVVGQKFKIYAYNGDSSTFQFAAEEATSGNTFFVKIGDTPQQSVLNMVSIINVSSSIKDFVAATSTDADLRVSLSQRVATFYGNTTISSSAPSTHAAITSFTGGTGALNYGMLVKLSGSLEDGTSSRSYYTKKFFSRSSHHFLERPIVEVQWDSAIKDDRANIEKSSLLKPAVDNLNNIYLYNKHRSGMVDIPNTSSNLVVQFVPSIGSAAEPITGPSVSQNYVTASKHSTGTYKAQFAYAGAQAKLHDVWKIHQKAIPATATIMVDTGTLGTSDIVITNADDTTLTLTAAALGGGNPSTATQINTDLVGSANDAATQLKASLDAAAAAGTLKMTVSSITNNSSGNPRVITLTQTVKGTSGNKAVSGTLVSGNKLIINNTSSSSQGTLSFTEGVDLAYTDIVSGSSFSIDQGLPNQGHEVPNYLTNITNLKPSYSEYEQATFRVYTRNKNWQPNLYTVASSKAPVNTIRDAFYKIRRVADNMTIIDYSTGSLRQYSSLSYDSDGSYFDLDMSILEPNYLYEISFLYKDNNDYLEQKEKFKFRVDP